MNTGNDTREQAAAYPSAVGEVQVTDAMTYAGLLALRDVGYHDETIDTEHMKIAIAAALSSQAPKPASVGGEFAEDARDVLDRFYWMLSPDAKGNHTVKHLSVKAVIRLCEKIIAAEADTATPPDRLAPIEARGAVTVDMASLFAPERMPARDEDGHACHPDLSLRCLYDFDPDDEAPLSKECLASLGWEYRITSFDHDDAEDDDDPCETYYRAGIAWQPEPPGPEWRLVCTSQDEDGDWNAWWVRRIAETLRARESATAVESIAAKGILLVLAIFGAIGSARADTLRIDAAGQRIKYNGAVALIEEPTLTSPARLSFVQSGLPIGGSTQGKSPPGAVPFVLEFTDRNGVVHELACVGPPPAFDGVTFHAHFVCEVQP